MVVSCAVAYVFPFELFLFSYAVLGPLDYRTEISWLFARYGSFQTLNAELIKLFGLGRGTTLAEIYDSPAGLSVMRLIAFAYTYHYLNWFSKASVIKRHVLTRRRTAVIAGLWGAALVPFAFSYELGFVSCTCSACCT